MHIYGKRKNVLETSLVPVCIIITLENAENGREYVIPTVATTTSAKIGVIVMMCVDFFYIPVPFSHGITRAKKNLFSAK